MYAYKHTYFQFQPLSMSTVKAAHYQPDSQLAWIPGYSHS